MALYDRNSFETGEAVNITPLTFLPKLESLMPPNLKEVCQSLTYLDTLSQGSEDPDTNDFRNELLTVAEGLWHRVTKDGTPIDWERLEEIFNYHVEVLFNTLSPQLRASHNHTVQNLAEQVLSPEAVEATLKTEVDPSLKKILAHVLKALKDKVKIKLSAKQLVQVLAACAVLSIPSDKIQFEAGPEIFHKSPTQPVVTQFQDTVDNIIAPAKDERIVNLMPPAELEMPTPDRPFELHETIPYPQTLVTQQRENGKKRVGINDRFENAMKIPEKRDLFYNMHNNGTLDPLVSVLAMVESNVDPHAESDSDAMGMMQDMGELQGAFGDPQTLIVLVKQGLMPNIDHKNYNRALSHGPTALIKFLQKEQKDKTPFWKSFLKSQAALIKNPQTGQLIAHFYIQSLRHQATKLTGIKDPQHLENQYITAMGYNAGMGNVRKLKRIMNRNEVEEFTTDSALRFLSQEKRPLAVELKKHTYNEARDYVARTIGMFEILAEQKAVAKTT